MILKSEQMDYRDKNRKHIMYMLFTTIIFLGCAILGIQIIDINSINSLPILNDLNSINIIVGIIAIPSCLLYYYMLLELSSNFFHPTPSPSFRYCFSTENRDDKTIEYPLFIHHRGNSLEQT